MTTETTDPTAELLEAELEDLRAAHATALEQIERLRQEITQAQDDEGEAMELAGKLHAVSDPLVLATRAQGSLGVTVGDVSWRANHPAASAAHGRAQAADDAVRQATVKVHRLSKARERVEYDLLPAVEGQLHAKQIELDRHRQKQEQAAEKVKTSRLARLGNKLRGATD